MREDDFAGGGVGAEGVGGYEVDCCAAGLVGIVPHWLREGWIHETGVGPVGWVDENDGCGTSVREVSL